MCSFASTRAAAEPVAWSEEKQRRFALLEDVLETEEELFEIVSRSRDEKLRATAAAAAECKRLGLEGKDPFESLVKRAKDEKVPHLVEGVCELLETMGEKDDKSTFSVDEKTGAFVLDALGSILQNPDEVAYWKERHLCRLAYKLTEGTKSILDAAQNAMVDPEDYKRSHTEPGKVSRTLTSEFGQYVEIRYSPGTHITAVPGGVDGPETKLEVGRTVFNTDVAVTRAKQYQNFFRENVKESFAGAEIIFLIIWKKVLAEIVAKRPEVASLTIGDVKEAVLASEYLMELIGKHVFRGETAIIVGLFDSSMTAALSPITLGYLGYV